VTRSTALGVLVVDKPRGCTSFDVVAQARRVFQTRSVGHAGTLDPMATGVLLLMFGEATKLSPVLTGIDKTYEAEISFGRSTDTFDAEGTTIGESLPVEPDVLALERAFTIERERREQIPPAHSAVHVQGQRAYELARQGRLVDLPSRAVSLRSLELIDLRGAKLQVRLAVSKGYYVRSFARDLCESLGLLGHLSALRRTSSGSFTLSEAQPWPPAAGVVPELMALSDAARRALPPARLTSAGTLRARQGKLLGQDDFLDPPQGLGPHAWLDETDQLVALGDGDEAGFRVRRGFTAALPAGTTSPPNGRND
jgi:tRNA pseudouridine55 synthase